MKFLSRLLAFAKEICQKVKHLLMLFVLAGPRRILTYNWENPVFRMGLRVLGKYVHRRVSLIMEKNLLKVMSLEHI